MFTYNFYIPERCSLMRVLRTVDLHLQATRRRKHKFEVRLSDTSGLASNPANRQIVLSSGGVGAPKKDFLDFFYFLLLKKLEKYDLIRPKVSKYSLTS